MTIADRIRNRRLELGLSVDDLANRLHKNRATVYRYESSYIKSYSPDVMEFLAKALETTPAYFYGYEDADHKSDGSANADEIRITIPGIRNLSPEQLERAKNAFRAMLTATYPEIFDAEKEKSP